MKLKYLLFAPIFLLFLSASAELITFSDYDLSLNSDYTWNTDNEYLLDGFAYLEVGSTLTIELGTVISVKQVPSTSKNSFKLTIIKNAQIFEERTINNSIIFTAEDDNIKGNTDFSQVDHGNWIGIAILGNARITYDACKRGLPSIFTLACIQTNIS